jgi:DNA-binding transcriptional regulator YiaG
VSQDESDDYPNRPAADPFRVAALIEHLQKLERKTRPDGGAASAEGKDLAAFDALETAGRLVRALAGWALDHQAGLALKKLKFLPLQPSGTRNHPEYRASRANVDDHAHEKEGGTLGLDARDVLDPIVARKLLFNLLYANPAGFHAALREMAMEALEALDYGEIQPMLARETDGRKRSLTVHKLELQAIAFVEYRRERGGNKSKAQKQVANALGVSVETLKSWEHRLRKDFGDLEIERTISFACNSARNEDATQLAADGGDAGAKSRIGTWERSYGADALQKLAKQYKDALRLRH